MSSSSNILKVLVGPHQPEKLLAVTTPITAIKAKLPAHLQEELPNLRALAWRTWTHTTAMGTDKTQEEPTACECPLNTVPSSRVAHWEQTSTKVLVSHLCLTQSSGVGERHFMRERMDLHQQKHRIRPRKTNFRLTKLWIPDPHPLHITGSDRHAFSAQTSVYLL